MDEECNCGHPECKGYKTLGPDPYAEEIWGDNSDYLMCGGERWEAAMDI